jgi:hypothetical protein
VSHLFNSPNCHIFAFGGIFELFVLECQVGTKSDFKAVVGKRQKLFAKKIMFCGPQSGLFEVLIQ